MIHRMVLKRALLLLFATTISASAMPQSILFTVDGVPAYSDEFEYVYKKNSSNNPDAFTSDDLEEYFELFLNFKLKVREAYSKGMNQDSSLIKEFESYKKQLRKPYLTDTKVAEKLVGEAYQRLQEEVNASHILIRLEQDAAPADTLAAFERIKKVWSLAQTTDFAKLAALYSEDGGGGARDGNLGYFTSMQMVYPFESTAYSTPVGSISKPFRTQFGYHIIKVNARRPSQGKVQVAHIMIRFDQQMSAVDSASIEKKIFDIAEQLSQGYDWDELCKLYSEDPSTKDKGGVLQPFRTGNIPPTFSETALALQTPGEISDPFTTPFGWHIVKLVKKLGVEPFEEIKSTLSARVNSDSRAQIQRKALIERLINENGVVIDHELVAVIKNGDSETAQSNANKKLLSIQGNDYFVSDYLQTAKPTSTSIQDFIDAKIIEYEENHLQEKYPDFRHLLNEYWEGILLFQVMDEEIWKKASTDSAGLSNFFSSNSQKYKWKERLVGSLVMSHKKNIIDSLESLLLREKTPNLEGLVEANSRSSADFSMIRGSFEKGSKQLPVSAVWREGLQKGQDESMFYLLQVDQILPVEQKLLSETKGLVISDYQDHLEELWLEGLQKKFTVKINKKIVKNVYQKLKD